MSCFPPASPSNQYDQANASIQTDTPLTRHLSGRLKSSILSKSRPCLIRKFYSNPDISLLSKVLLPKGTRVEFSDQDRPVIKGYWLTETTEFEGIYCKEGTPVFFDEKGFLCRATPAELVWLPDCPPCKPGQEYEFHKGKPVFRSDPQKAEETFQSFFNSSSD